MPTCRRYLFVALSLLLALVGPIGCASRPGAAGGLFGAPLSPALEAQRQRLQQVLKGTPVAVESTGDRRLRLAVPTRYSFDAGKSVVKPPLAAVLDQFAIGFRPQAATTELTIAAPADDHAASALVQERAASVRDHLVGHGVPLSRITALGRADGAGLEIVVSDRPVNR